MDSTELMKRAQALAIKGLGSTWPNPLVGAVIVKNGRIIGEGHHEKCGEAHAEINALNSCKESPEGATIYVNLEPCCHTNKRTPPCAQRLIKEKIKKVIISNLDPNPEVSGKGVALLREHGIEVEVGLLESEGELINEVFFLAQRKKRPFIHLKLASSLDGKIALPSGESKWITGEKAREHVHILRSLHQAILVGAETIRKDNPKLNVRLPDFTGEQPLRIVLSRSGNLPQESYIFTDELKDKTFIYNSLEKALDDLFEKKVISLFLEGGPTLAGEFLSRRLVDRISLYQNPTLIGSGASLINHFALSNLGQRPKLKNITSEWIGEDFYLSGTLGEF
jgi:diaminohydroxyphosphoribosylaminopyrimidine deaminase/5-amino-6-(5-phosphoribosylamino)uracil reductase